MKNISKKICVIFVLSVLIYIDQATKLLSADRLRGQADYPLIPGILEFSYLENTGAAFGIFSGRQSFLIGLTGLIMLFLVFKYFHIPRGGRYLPLKAAFILIISGGIGNLIDRVSHGYVVDFIYFVPIDFPKFNAADCYVCIGMALLCILCFLIYKDEELGFLFTLRPRNKKR
ncbi:MAG: signal peptidase II [Lachnospiraceae bacterium]|nr:signal peptidase II [Lachnospiraceae bacterium]